MIQMGLEAAKDSSASSLYSKQTTIHVPQKSMTTNLLNGNLQIAKVGDVYANRSLFDSSAYLPQRDHSKISRICDHEHQHKN
jgi:hypothetical protein